MVNANIILILFKSKVVLEREGVGTANKIDILFAVEEFDGEVVLVCKDMAQGTVQPSAITGSIPSHVFVKFRITTRRVLFEDLLAKRTLFNETGEREFGDSNISQLAIELLLKSVQC